MKERDRIDLLQRRHDHLVQRIAERKAMPSYARSQSRDIAEASALRWVIALAELALANWPAGIHAVREQEDREELVT
jgi:hypothetical protein